MHVLLVYYSYASFEKGHALYNIAVARETNNCGNDSHALLFSAVLTLITLYYPRTNECHPR